MRCETCWCAETARERGKRVFGYEGAPRGFVRLITGLLFSLLFVVLFVGTLHCGLHCVYFSFDHGRQNKEKEL
jgi:hypothetical protein